MYICKECGEVFNEPAVEYDDPSPYGVGLPSGHYTYSYCPKCNCDDIDEASVCVSCGEYFDGDTSVGGLCEWCWESFTLRIAKLKDEMGMDDDEFHEAIASYFGW